MDGETVIGTSGDCEGSDVTPDGEAGNGTPDGNGGSRLGVRVEAAFGLGNPDDCNVGDSDGESGGIPDGAILGGVVVG